MIPEHRSRTLYKSNTLRVIDYHCRSSQSAKQPEEWCPRPEIVLPRSGVYVRHDADETVVVDPNQVLFFNGGQPYQISHPVDGGDRSTIFLLHPEVLLDMLRSLDPAVDELPERPFKTNHLILDTRLRILQYWLLQSAVSSPAEPLEIEEKVLLLLGEVLRAAQDAGDGRRRITRMGTARDHAGQVERVKLLLGERYRERLHLEQVAQAAYSSSYHLCRIFKNQTGLSIHQYLLNVRLAASLEQLAERPGDSLAMVALDLGFASHNHFTTVFRSKIGLSPSEFRRKVRSRTIRELSNFLEV
jgi:AraC-like DNA-binding protein